jgi:hypothetical protein
VHVVVHHHLSGADWRLRRGAAAVHLVPILIDGYHPAAAPSNPVAPQFLALDDIFARYPILTLVHILPALLFLVLGPLQFSHTFRRRHLHWHR